MKRHSKTVNIRLVIVMAICLIGLKPNACQSQAIQPSDAGFRLGYELQVGWQRMDQGVNQDDVTIYDDNGAMVSVLSLFSFSWGFESTNAYFEPIAYLGAGTGAIDNGRLISLADAEFDQYDGFAGGGGFKSRLSLAETRIRVGVDGRLIYYEGESQFRVDNLPGLNKTYDSKTTFLEVVAVLDYNDPRFRPYIAGGFMGFFNKFENKSNTHDTVEINSENPFGVKGGIEFRHLFDSGLYATIDLGYFAGGPVFALGAGYRF
jgi:hypothetical protein